MNRTKEEILSKLDIVPDYLGVGYEQSDVLDAMEEYTKECMPKWISVNDRLPEHGSSSPRVLFYHESGEIMMGILDENKMVNIFMADGLTIMRDQKGFTHWMLLPEPPTE